MTPSQLADEAQMCIWRPDEAGLARMLAEGLAERLPAGGEDQGRLLRSSVNRHRVTPASLGMLLEAGFAVDARGEFENTAFLDAVRFAMPEAVRRLLDAGADPYFVNFSGANALSMMVCQCGCGCITPEEKAAVWELLHPFDLKPDPGSPHFEKEAMRAGEDPGNGQRIRELLGYGVPLDGLGWTPLMLGIVLGTAESAEVAVLDSAALEKRDSWNRTLFLLAAQCGREAMVKALAERGSDVLAQGNDGKNALHYVAGGGHAALVEELLAMSLPLDSRNDKGETPLMMAVAAFEIEAVERLLALGADVNAESQDGETAILMAGDAEMMAVLIRAGANVRKENRHGYQALHSASNIEEIDLLLDAGADINAVSGGGSWVLQDVARGGDAEEVRHLLERGAIVDLTSACGETALFTAVRSGSLACVKVLLDAGAEVNRIDTDGWTCLWYIDPVDKAASLEMARYLIERGADPSLPQYGCAGNPFPENCQFYEKTAELREVLRHHRLVRQSWRG